MNRWIEACLFGALLLMVPECTRAYWVSSSRWAHAQTTFYVSLVNEQGGFAPGSGQSWDSAFAEAMAAWNNATDFQFSMVNESSDPCAPFDSRNGVAFADSICDDAFGSGVLAVTMVSWIGPYRTTADIVFNGQFTWDVYHGPLSQDAVEFRRVAVHELGHALGLWHEDGVTAMMNSQISDVEVPLLDDIEGVEKLYGGCRTISTLGTSEVQLQRALFAEDCFAAELGIFDQYSLLDEYSITVTEPGVLIAGVRSVDFDAFLMVFDESLTNLLASDDDSFFPWRDDIHGYSDTDAMINVFLEPGTYSVIVTSYFEFETGGYALDTSFIPEPDRLVLELTVLAVLSALRWQQRDRKGCRRGI